MYVATLILAFIAKQQRRNVIKGPTYVTRILDIVLRIFNVQLLSLKCHNFSIVFGDGIKLFPAVWTLG